MKIVIANGLHEADYIITMFNTKGNTLTVINSDKSVCEYLSLENNIDVLWGDPTQKYILEMADIYDCDLFLALSQNDIDNYVACIMAKTMFRVKKCVTTVVNPKNVDLFKSLGIDSVVSSTYLLAETVKTASLIDNFSESLSIFDNKIEMVEITIESDAYVVGKAIKEVKFPQKSQVCCIYRDASVIIPNGSTEIKAGDKMVIIYTPDEKDNLLGMLERIN